MACEKCELFGGLWMETESGLCRCTCSEGKRLKAADGNRVNPVGLPPVLSPEQAAIFVEMLASIPWFPIEPGARLGIGEELRSMCGGVKEAEWLVTRMRRLYNRWPGPIEMRRVYASRHQPIDGVLSIGASDVYPDGIPTENKTLFLPAGKPVAQLPEGNATSASPSLQRAIVALATAKDLNHVGRTPRVSDIPLRKVKPEELVTQADIDREIVALRDKRAKGEL